MVDMKPTCCSQGLSRFQRQSRKRLALGLREYDLYRTGISIKICHYSFLWHRNATGIRGNSTTMSDHRSIGCCTAVARHHGHKPIGWRSFVLGHARYPNSVRCRSFEDWEVAERAEVDEEGGFYSVFGVSPGASKGEIKKAYRKLMKDYHPDQSNDEVSNEFAIFLNQVSVSRMPSLRILLISYVVMITIPCAGVRDFDR